MAAFIAMTGTLWLQGVPSGGTRRPSRLHVVSLSPVVVFPQRTHCRLANLGSGRAARPHTPCRIIAAAITRQDATVDQHDWEAGGSRARRASRGGERRSTSRAGGGGGSRRGESEWEPREERRTQADRRDDGGGVDRHRAVPYSSRGADSVRPVNRSSPRAWMSRQLKDTKSCLQLLQLLENQPPEALTAVNLATCWVRLGNLHSHGGRGVVREAMAEASGDAVAEEEEEEQEITASPCTAVARQLLEPTAAAAAEMDLRQIANSVWGMAKLGDSFLDLPRGRDGESKGSPSISPGEVIRRLQQRAVELLQPLSLQQQQQQAAQGADRRACGGGVCAPAALDMRDATQLWYGMVGLRHSWSEAYRSALEEATIRALEAAFVPAVAVAVAVPAVVAGDATAPQRQDTSSSPLPSSSSSRPGASGDGGGGGHSRGGGDGGGSWAESPTAAAQIVFRMAAASGGARMPAERKARLAAVVDAMSYGNDNAAAAPPPLDSPDCLLIGSELLRLDVPSAAVWRLHDMALALPPAAAGRTGRTAMARALKSATALGIQPSAREARQWQQRLLEELGPCGGGDGGRWSCEELSWTMLALSNVRAYLPDEGARGELLGALRRVVRQLRANDATRVQQALGVWGLRLPEREAALLRQKASGAAPMTADFGPGAARRGGGRGHGGGREFAWGFRR